MDKLNQENEEKVFRSYVSEYKKDALESHDEKEQKKLMGYIDKEEHSIFVRNESINAFKLFKFDETYTDLVSLMALLHDIGRFEQLKQTGVFEDKESYGSKKNSRGINYDHGDQGYEILVNNQLIRLFLNHNYFDKIIASVVRNHSRVITDLSSKIDKKHFQIYKKTDVYDLLSLPQEESIKRAIQTLEALSTATVQDTDRLDIYRKILSGKWLPVVTSDEIPKEIFEKFKLGKMETMNELKDNGKWNPNLGHLVRLSFISQINLVSVLKMINNEQLISRIYAIYQQADKHSLKEISDYSIYIRKVQMAYEYTDEFVKELIRNGSVDGILIDEDARQNVVTKVNKKMRIK